MITLRHTMWMGAATALGLTLAVPSCGGDDPGTNNNPDMMVSPTAPMLTTVAPALGPTSGNTTLTLTGSNFTSSTKVTIGATMATNVSFVSATQLTVTLPAQPTAFGKVPVVVTNTDGQKTSRSDLFSYYAVTVDFTAGAGITAGMGPAGIASGDFNGDGKMDVVVGNQTSKDLTVMLSSATTAGLTPRAAISTGGAVPLSLAVGDLNGDQKLDLVFITNNGTDINVMIGDGTGSFAAPVKYAASTGTRSLLLVDLNGDKSPDAVVVNNNKGVSTLISTKDGKFATATSVTVGTLPNAVAAGDFNGDGKIDLVVSDGTANSGSMLAGMGDGKLATAVAITVGTTATDIATGDFNGDGKLDAVFLSGTGIVFSAGNGNGGFATAVPTAVTTVPQALTAGDFNGDGITDLAVIDISVYKAFVFISGMTGFGTPKMYTTGNSPYSLTVGDFDGDQRPDIAIANQATNDVTILTNKSQ